MSWLLWVQYKRYIQRCRERETVAVATVVADVETARAERGAGCVRAVCRDGLEGVKTRGPL